MNIFEENWAVPNSLRAMEIVATNIDEVLSSLRYLAEFSDLPRSHLDSLDKILTSDIKRSMAPQIFAVHEAVRLSVERVDRDRTLQLVVGLIDEAAITWNRRNGLRIIRHGTGYGRSTADAIDLVHKISEQETYDGMYAGEKSIIFSPSIQEKYDTDAALGTAFDALEKANPSLKQEIESLIGDIVIFDSNGVNAGTYIHTLGAIYIRVFRTKTEHWSRIMEHVIHESAHNLLYHVWYQEKVIFDDEGMFYTPFRSDHRPLSAIFQAMFVLARTIYGFNCLLADERIGLKSSDIKSNYNEANNSISFKEKFLQTVDVIRKSGKATKFGNRIVKDCEELVQRCSFQI